MEHDPLVPCVDEELAQRLEEMEDAPEVEAKDAESEQPPPDPATMLNVRLAPPGPAAMPDLTVKAEALTTGLPGLVPNCPEGPASKRIRLRGEQPQATESDEENNMDARGEACLNLAIMKEGRLGPGTGPSTEGSN